MCDWGHCVNRDSDCAVGGRGGGGGGGEGKGGVGEFMNALVVVFIHDRKKNKIKMGEVCYLAFLRSRSSFQVKFSNRSNHPHQKGRPGKEK